LVEWVGRLEWYAVVPMGGYPRGAEQESEHGRSRHCLVVGPEGRRVVSGTRARLQSRDKVNLSSCFGCA